MWFTRDNFNNGKTQRSDDRTIKLKMYSQYKEDKGWSDAVEFIYNNNEYSTGHPSLSADGQSLYFASDRPGGFGGVDIYVCKNELGRWSAPLNMGPEINTEGNEMFPYISSNNTLYYSSNGRKGLGGLDIYSSSNKDGQWSRPQNLGYPINTSKDDFGITTNETGEEGYFSSNRGSTDDIYSFRKECRIINVLVYEKGTNNPIEASDVKVVDKQSKEEVRVTDKEGQFTMCLTPGREYEFIANKADYKANSEKLNTLTLGAEKVIVRIPLEKPSAFALEGKVYSMDTKELMAGVKVTLFNYCNNKTEEIITGADGKYSFNLKPECKYKVTATKPDCGTQSIEKNTIGLKNSQTLYADFALLCKGQVIKIDNIYYDLDKYNIRPDAARELDKTLSVLNQYPTMKIELRSHTDCRAPDEYNKKLSQNRAQAAVNYLVTKGISSTRMKAAGYGEDIPVNGCVDGANCTEEQHQANRRTEFKILSF
jgi:outer membrane protein OmpA-like peptidoglycan-associated protein